VTRHLIDSVACAFGALGARPARVARTIAGTASSSAGASVFGLAQPTTPEYATFANTVMVRYLDYNDTGNGGHPSDMMSGVLALGEARGASGAEVIRAIHAAYETYAAIRRGGLYGNLLRNKHVDQIYATLGAVVGAGVILGLDLERMGHAIALALTPNIPMRVTRTGLISDWKGCATAHGTMNAVFAARLAEQGLTGPDRPFEGLAAFYQMLGIPPLDLSTLGETRNGLSALQSTGLKYYPPTTTARAPSPWPRPCAAKPPWTISTRSSWPCTGAACTPSAAAPATTTKSGTRKPAKWPTTAWPTWWPWPWWMAT
jgi:2-methylcitrate dehydratase